MDEIVNQLGNKTAGQLIKSEDWNGLVAAIENLSATVDERFTTVESRLQELDTRVDTLSQEFGVLREMVEPLLDEYYRLTLETTRINYAIGELAQITARVTNLRGGSLDLTNEADRPWIDFVVGSWGQLKPVAGFQSLGGAGDRTISVRTNAQGIARVNLRSDHAEGFTDEDEAEVALSLETKLSTINQTVAQTILAAATPMEAKNMGAFQTLTAEYDRTDAPRVRNYADAYYLKNAALIAGNTPPIFTPPIFTHKWRDYRSTVMAFARRDSDPTTPDQSRGVSSIQVTFRDWIGPWINIDYFVETTLLVENFRDRLAPKITRDLGESVLNVKAEVNELVLDKGLIGRQRNYRVIQEALDEVTAPQPLDFPLNKLTRPMQDAIGVQQALESVQSAAIGPAGQEVAFGAFADATVRADTQAAEVESKLTGYVDEHLSEAQNQLVFQVQQQQANLKNELLAEDGLIQTVHKDLQTVSGRVQGFQEALQGKADVQTLARFLPQ